MVCIKAGLVLLIFTCHATRLPSYDEVNEQDGKWEQIPVGMIKRRWHIGEAWGLGDQAGCRKMVEAGIRDFRGFAQPVQDPEAWLRTHYPKMDPGMSDDQIEMEITRLRLKKEDESEAGVWTMGRARCITELKTSDRGFVAWVYELGWRKLADGGELMWRRKQNGDQPAKVKFPVHYQAAPEEEVGGHTFHGNELLISSLARFVATTQFRVVVDALRQLQAQTPLDRPYAYGGSYTFCPNPDDPSRAHAIYNVPCGDEPFSNLH